MTAVPVLLALLWLGAVVPLLRSTDWCGWNALDRSSIAAVAVWSLLAVALLIDFATPGHLCVPWLSFDLSFRAQYVNSIANSNFLPPINFLFRPEQPIALRYHYFSFLFGALMERMSGGHVSARAAVEASILWIGAGWLVTIAAIFRYFLPQWDRKRSTKIAWVVLLIGGLDIIPIALETILRLLQGRSDFISVPSVDWWNGAGQVTGWMDTLLWVPNHTAGLIACVVACLILWDARGSTGQGRTRAIAAAGLALASAVGLSVFVTLVFAVFLVLVTIWSFKNERRSLAMLIGAGVVSIVLTLPFLHELTARKDPALPPAVIFSVRDFDPITSTLLHYGIQSKIAWNLAKFLALPVNYALEFGFFLVVGIWWWLAKRREGLDTQGRLLAALLAVSVVIATFLRSGSQYTNDLGWRGMLPAQLVLLLWAVELIQRKREENSPIKGAMKRLLVFAAVLGIATTALEVVLLRGFIAFSDRGWTEPNIVLDEDNAASRFNDQRQAYLWIRQNTPQSAIVQQNPYPWQAISLGLYADRPTVLTGRSYSTAFGGEYRVLLPIYRELRNVFEYAASDDEIINVCRRYHIDYVVIQDRDSLWYNRKGFAWDRPALFATPRVRVYSCK